MVVHQKPLERADLLSEMCKAKGLVHYARADANPRVVYESIVAGLPVFVSEQSNIPQKLQQQPFVHVTPWEPIRTRSIRKLNKDFSKFMKYISSVNQKKLQATIDKFISSELTEEASYNGICIKMGICEETREGAAATGFYSACLVGLVTASAVVIFVVCRSAGVGPRTERSRVPGYL